jgi:lysophospholipase L1-like esterase
MGSAMLALVCGEISYRRLHREPTGVQRYYAVDGPAIPPFEMVYFMSSWPWLSQRQPTATPRGWLPPGLHYRMGYEAPTTSYFDEDGAITYRINSLGFRDLEFAATKKANEWRILTLGDSFTMGWGVRLEDSWPQLLERSLQAGRRGPVEVINGGFACLSFSCAKFDDWVEREGVRFAPDVAIVGFCLNDFHSKVPLLSYPVLPLEPICGSLLLGEIRRTSQLRSATAEPRDMARVVRADPRMWKDTQAGLQRLHAVLKQHDVPMLVTILPMLSELGSHYPYANLHSMLREFCAAEGIACLDLLPDFQGLDERTLWVHPTDQHPNAKATRIIAAGIARWLQTHDLAGANSNTTATAPPRASRRQ